MAGDVAGGRAGTLPGPVNRSNDSGSHCFSLKEVIVKARWFVPALLLAAAPAPAQAQFAIDLLVGPNWSSISNVPSNVPSQVPAGTTSSSDIGYFLGGRVRFGKSLFYVAPGLYYQYQSFILNGSSTAANISDNIGLSSFQIPLEVGVNLNAKIVAFQLGVAGTMTLNTSVNNNEWGATKDGTNNTRWGWMLTGSARILILDVNLAWQRDFTNTFKNDANGGKLGQFRVGFGIGF
jgi:hypothetical protein